MLSTSTFCSISILVSGSLSSLRINSKVSVDQKKKKKTFLNAFHDLLCFCGSALHLERKKNLNRARFFPFIPIFFLFYHLEYRTKTQIQFLFPSLPSAFVFIVISATLIFSIQFNLDSIRDCIFVYLQISFVVCWEVLLYHTRTL